MSGWSNGVADFDNDGWKDLFIARSNVLDNISEFSTRTYPETNSVFRNLGGGRFEEVSATAGPDFQKPAVNRGVALGDLDNDGRVDIVISVLNGRARILRNVTNAGNWITFQLVGTKSNRMGIGTQIRITVADGTAQYDICSTSTGYAASSDPRVHFGIGANKWLKEVQLHWPSGTVQVLKDVPANQFLRVEEPQ